MAVLGGISVAPEQILWGGDDGETSRTMDLLSANWWLWLLLALAVVWMLGARGGRGRGVGRPRLLRLDGYERVSG